MYRVLTAFAALALAPAALAADLPARQYGADAGYTPPTMASNWTGFYAGLNGGGNWGSFTGGAGNLFGSASGAVFGATVGYNYQYQQLVFGAEGDWDFDGARGRTFGGTLTGAGQLTSIMSIRARAGFAADRALVYVTGGYAGGTLQGSLLDTSLPAGAQYFTTSGWRSGYALGAGIEYAFTDKISGKAEYIYSNLGSQTIFSAPRATNVGVQENEVRAGVNYHF